ncbi:MAG: T9SS type A sorting domain-containing protein [Saprospiraceae bacterium]
MKLLFATFFNFFLCSSLLAQWESMNGPFGGYINDLKGNNSFQFAATPDGLFRTHDTGKSWTLLDIKNGKKFACLQIGIQDSSLVVDLVALEGQLVNRYLFESHDNGNSWKRLSRPLVNDYLSIALNSYSIYVYDFNHLWVSLDGGNSWTYSNISDQGLSNLHLYTYNNYIYVASNKKMYKSANIGDQFEEITIGDLSGYIESVFAFESIIFVFDSDGKIYRTPDAGLNWSNLNTELSGEASFVKLQNNYFLGSWNSLYKSDNQGLTWHKQIINSYPDAAYHIIAASNNLMICEPYRGVSVSPDEGRNFHDANTGIHACSVQSVLVHNDKLYTGQVFKGISCYDFTSMKWDTALQLKTNEEITDIDIINEDIVAISGYHQIFRLGAADNQWKNVSPADHPTISQFYHHNQSIFAGDFAGHELFRSTDSGATWQNYFLFLDGVKKQPRILASDNHTIITANLSELFRTQDNGVTWQKSMEGIYFNQMGLSNFFRLYAFNHTFFALEANDSLHRNAIELNVSYDDGLHWQLSTNGLPDHPFDNGILSITAVGNILIASMLNDLDGVFVSFDNALTWHPFNDGFDRISVNEVAFDQNYLYAATNYRGVWRRKISDLFTTSTKAPSLNNDLIIFPNPSSGNFTLKVDAQLTGNANILISDIHGRICQRMNIDVTSETTIETENLVSGLYFLSIQTANRSYTTKFAILK